jgi:nucleotide-binding universal stress UspA family protein
MFRQIVVGVDEHEGGRDAIALAKSLLAPDGELTLAHVYAGDPHTYRSASAAYEAAERERARELLEKTRDKAEIEATVRSIGSPSVGRGLHELAEHQSTDLLVLGSCRRSLLGRVLVGDDTRAALTGAPCAVAIAPAGYLNESSVMREIGVGYDGSPESDHALDLARELANERGAKLSAFEAVSLPTTAFTAGPLPLGETIDALVSEARDRIAALGGVEPHAAYGQPAEELAVYSASLDLLMVGSRGYGPIGRLIHGSTSHQLAHMSRCPLLVLTRATGVAGTPHMAKDVRETAGAVVGMLVLARRRGCFRPAPARLRRLVHRHQPS